MIFGRAWAYVYIYMSAIALKLIVLFKIFYADDYNSKQKNHKNITIMDYKMETGSIVWLLR